MRFLNYLPSMWLVLVLLLDAPARAQHNPLGSDTAKPIKLLATIKTGLDHGFASLAVSADGAKAIGMATNDKKNVQIWDLAAGKMLHAYDSKIITGMVSVAVLPGDKEAAYTDQRLGAVVIVDLMTGKEARQLTDKSGGGLSYYLGALAIAPKENLLVLPTDTSGGRCDLVGWNPRTGERTFRYAPKRPVRAVSALFEDGTKIALGGEGFIEFWDLKEGKATKTFEPKVSRQVRDLAVTADGKKLAYFATADPVRIVDVATGTLDENRQAVAGVMCRMRVLSDGKSVVYADLDGHLRVVDLTTARTTHLSAPSESVPSSLAVSADGTRLVTSERGSLKVWRLEK